MYFLLQINCDLYELTDSRNKSVNLIHIRADGTEDSIHYLWSSFNLPSVIVARTATNTNVSVNIEKLKNFKSGAIVFNSTLLAFKGLTISEVIYVLKQNILKTFLVFYVF